MPPAARPVPDPESTGDEGPRAAAGIGPLFSKELLHGAEALSARSRARVLDRLAGVAHGRPVPLHAATAWNALHFGYDVARGSYAVQPDLEGLVSLKERPRPSLPVGTFVVYDRGDHFLGGEVVASFGADHRVCADADGWVDPGLTLVTRDTGDGESGDDNLGRERVLVECSVVDWTVFGPLGHDEKNELLRCRRRAASGGDHLLDIHGHASGPTVHRPHRPGDAPHGPVSTAAIDTPAGDLKAYAEHLLRHPALLTCGPIPSLLPRSDDPELLYRAVLASLTTVAELLSSVPGLLTWAGYATPENRYAERAASSGLLGGEDLREVAYRTRRSGAGRPRLTAVLPALAGLVASANERSAAERETSLGGTALAEAVVHANLMIQQTAQEAGGTVRLRDAWQGGGIWENPASEQDAPPNEGNAANEDPLADLSAVEDSTVFGSVPLRRAHLERGLLPLPEQVRAALRGREIVAVDLSGPREILGPGEAIRRGQVTDDGLWLEWPTTILPGQRATVSAAVGGCRVRVDLTEAEQDEENEDHGTGLNTPPISGKAGLSDPGAGDELRGIVLETIRLDGDPGRLGSRSMPADRILTAVVQALTGGEHGNPVLRQAVLAACHSLAASHLLQLTPGTVTAGPGGTVEHSSPATFTWWPGGLPPHDEAPGPADAGSGAAPAGTVAQHQVSPFVRRLPRGHRASRAAERDFAEFARSHGEDARLPEGATFVRSHLRGGQTVSPPESPDDP